MHWVMMDDRVVFLGNDRRPIQGLSQMSIAGLGEFGPAADGSAGCTLPGGEAGEGSQLARRGEGAPVTDFGHHDPVHSS